MSKFKAVRVSKIEELENAIRNNCAVIAVDNKILFAKIKKIAEQDAELQEKARKMTTGGVTTFGASAALLALTCLVETVCPPVGVVCGLSSLAGMSGGIMVTALGVGRKLWANITAELKNYKWFESADKKYLILYKAKGTNRFNPKTDELDI